LVIDKLNNEVVFSAQLQYPEAPFNASVTIVSPFTQSLTSQFISPDYFANAIEYSVAIEKATRSEAED